MDADVFADFIGLGRHEASLANDAFGVTVRWRAGGDSRRTGRWHRAFSKWEYWEPCAGINRRGGADERAVR
jgi:hypothetical protein